MATATLSLELCAPEKPHTELDVTDVTIPGTAGVFAVHPDHTPLLSTLIPGVLIANTVDGQERHFAVHGGFAEIKQNKVIILATFYEPGDDIDATRAQTAEERALARLQKPPEDMDWDRAEHALARAVARLRASKKQSYV